MTDNKFGRVFWTRPFILTTYLYHRQPSQKDLAELKGDLKMSVRIIQLGSARHPEEGIRLGTVRRPPRGVRKNEYAKLNYYDVWLLMTLAESK